VLARQRVLAAQKVVPRETVARLRRARRQLGRLLPPALRLRRVSMALAERAEQPGPVGGIPARRELLEHAEPEGETPRAGPEVGDLGHDELVVGPLGQQAIVDPLRLAQAPHPLVHRREDELVSHRRRTRRERLRRLPRAFEVPLRL
jgi:hypothetical protein